ncbi:molybdopterin cofactor-binding domain-containing protein [Rhizobium mesoamericanum]|uniref:molybdopterin cofactor-binding domain-containing protein n=1 Tax=Rhizobium mesoamericanum TaxID=1079800 RepID=UPI000414C76D|nr:molybdopterin cofactor-binding domain-containing protein [Rhizobium mesoamericanum]
MAFARYKNLGAYCAACPEVKAEQDTGKIQVLRAQAAVDCGEPVKPNGIANKVEGAIIQSVSWCTREAVGNTSLRTTFDWSEYPVLRFLDVPEA